MDKSLMDTVRKMNLRTFLLFIILQPYFLAIGCWAFCLSFYKTLFLNECYNCGSKLVEIDDDYICLKCEGKG